MIYQLYRKTARYVSLENKSVHYKPPERALDIGEYCSH